MTNIDPIVMEVIKQAPAVGVLCFAVWKVYNDLIAILRDNRADIQAIDKKVDELSIRLAKIEAKQ